MSFPVIKAWAFKRMDQEIWCIATVEPCVENLYLKQGEEVVYYELKPISEFQGWIAVVRCCYVWCKRKRSVWLMAIIHPNLR